MTISHRSMPGTRRPQRSAAGKIMAVASGKGGVGKTWLAITLSHALALAGRKVLLIDADFGLANIDIQIGLNPRYDLGHVLDQTVDCMAAINRYESGGFDILPGRSGCTRIAGLSQDGLTALLMEFEGVAASYDHVIVDLGAGIDRHVRQIAAWSDTLLVLLTDEPTSLTDAYAVLKLHAADSGAKDSRVLVNLASSETAARHTAMALQRACQQFLGFTPPWSGTVRRSPGIPESIRRQALSNNRHPTSPATQDVQTLAAGLYDLAA